MNKIKTIKDSLLEMDFFKGIDKEMIEYISLCGSNKHFHQGQFLGKEGEAANNFYIIRSGRVALQLHHHDKGTIMLKTIHQGEVLGVSWIVPPYRLNFDLLALEETSVIEFNGKCIRDKCDDDHTLGYLLLRKFTGMLSERLKNTRIQLLDVYR